MQITTITNTVNFIKKHKGFLVICGVIIICTSLLITAQHQSRQKPTPSPMPVQISKLPIEPAQTENANAIYTNNIGTAPNVDNVYIFTTSNDQSSYIDPTDLGFTSTDYDQGSNTWFNASIGRFNTSTQPNHIYFQPPLPKPFPEPQTINNEQVQQANNSVITTYKLSPESHPLLVSQIQYLLSNGYNALGAKSIKDANLIKTTYAFSLEGRSLYMSTAPLESCTISITSTFTTNNISCYQFPTIIQKTPTAPISLATAFKALQANQGTLISATTPGNTEAAVELNYSNASITKSSLVYLYLSNESKIVPAYLLFGTAPSTSNGQQYNVTYVVPAYSDQ
jgi:hypothetical protein